MELLSRLLGWLFGRESPASDVRSPAIVRETPTPAASYRRWRRARLHPRPKRDRLPHKPPIVTPSPAYLFARRAMGLDLLPRRDRPRDGRYWDFSQDGNAERLAERSLPRFSTPEELAQWLGLPVGKVAWLSGRLTTGGRPPTVHQAHYHYQWKAKRRGGHRLLESPKPLLSAAQEKILREILDRVPAHPAAHGFVRTRSILTNARPHCGQAVLLKFDLENFYASVRFSRVTAIFRSLGYSREAALWLAALVTSNIPANLELPRGDAHALEPYLGRHLPQGACTSPAIANLSAWRLDARLAGLARSFGGVYTRYADDLAFSGDATFARRLRNLIPLVEAVIRQERFRVHPGKRKVLRAGTRQSIAGVIVNEKPNIAREEFDQLKAILFNCARFGPESQNRSDHPLFAEHLRGRIAHVSQLNPHRGKKLIALFERIRFT